MTEALRAIVCTDTIIASAGSPVIAGSRAPALRNALSIASRRSGFNTLASSVAPPSHVGPAGVRVVIADHLEMMLQDARDRSAHGFGVPHHVEDNFRRYLACGDLSRGFARVVCRACHYELLVPFSCKVRACPSCEGRRMTDGAARLVDSILPRDVDYRHWTLSFPRWLRARLLRDPAWSRRSWACSCAPCSPITGDAHGIAASPTALPLQSRRFSWEVRSQMPTPTSTPFPRGRARSNDFLLCWSWCRDDRRMKLVVDAETEDSLGKETREVR